MDNFTEFHNLCTMAMSIATHLPGWIADINTVRPEDSPPRYVVLGRDDGAGIALRFMRNKPGRLEVSGRYPHEAYLSPDRPSITLAANRPAQKVAQEITRRFLPAYLERWEEAQGQVISLRQAEARVKYTAELCAQIVALPLDRITYHQPQATGATLYTKVGQLTVERSGTVRLETKSLQPTVALDVLKRLMDIS